MSKHIQLSIAEPCHENWDKMTKVEKGKFCNSCQKQVVDFSNLNDREIAQFFKKSSVGNVCGRFMQGQLNRSIEIPRKRIPWAKYFFQFLLPAFLVSCKDNLQGKIKVTETEVIPEPKCTTTVGLVMAEIETPLFGDSIDIGAISKKKEVDTVPDLVFPHYVTGDIEVQIIRKSVVIKGNVIDENNNPIPMASIGMENLPSLAVADSLGDFSLTINSDQNIIPIEVSSTGYESKKINYNRSDSSELVIKLKPDIKILDSVTVQTSLEKFTKGKVVGTYSVCRESKATPEVKIIPEHSNKSMKLFPNPINSGATINIEWINNDEIGNFALQLFNLSGQLTFTKEKWIDNETGIMNVQLPSITAGNYFLRMVNKKSGKSYTEKLIIQ